MKTIDHYMTRDVQLGKLERQKQDLEDAFEHLALAQHYLDEAKEDQDVRNKFESILHAWAQADFLRCCCLHQGRIWKYLDAKAGKILDETEREIRRMLGAR